MIMPHCHASLPTGRWDKTETQSTELGIFIPYYNYIMQRYTDAICRIVT